MIKTCDIKFIFKHSAFTEKIYENDLHLKILGHNHIKEMIMKKTLLSLLLITMGLSATETIQEEPCCPMVNYNGFYLGGAFGFEQFHLKNTDTYFNDIRLHTIRAKNNKARVELQLGYDWQFCDKVVGLVLDLDTIRLRGGMLFGNHLLFATTGAACRVYTYKVDEGTYFSIPTEEHRIRWGWSVGAGTESPLWGNITIGTKFLFNYFPEKSYHGHAGYINYRFKTSTYMWSAGVSINYRFGNFRCCQ